MDAQMCKIVTNRQTNHEKRGPENLHMEMAKQGETKALQSLIFQSIPTRNRSLAFSDLLRVCSKRHPKPFEIEACGCLWRRKLVGERFQKHTKKKHQKSTNICQKCTQKRYPEKRSFCCFSGSGARGAPGWSQRTPGAPCKVKSCRNLCNKWCAELYFCDVLFGLAPD